MKNYNFEILSSYEFELFSRDLLQLHLEIHLESFGEGPDQGIDLRCTKGQNLIVQAKRYKNFPSLVSNLKKEKEKVQKLKPERYILTTNASLSPGNKETIKELFKPYLKSNEDILGKEDLNNLLSKFPQVETSFYKLWLSSVDVLQRILNSQIINKSKFVLEDIQAKISVYVQNDSFKEALSIIKLNKYVIISGTPGIGKTTLAEMLVFDLLSNGMEEFIYLSDSINDGYKYYIEEKSQVFLFDDFLGSNFLHNSLPTNEEKQIVKFIDRIQRSKNKVLIFTTREYILNQAKQRFEVFEKDFSKCILDISKYSTLVRAQILYNHLSVNSIPFEYIDEIIKQKYLFKIINHENYNPRIIESFTKKKLWMESNPEDFPAILFSLFEYPYLVWQHVYENQISYISTIILNSLLISGEDIDYNELFEQVKYYIEQNNDYFDFSVNSSNYKISIKELEDSLIQINRRSNDKLLIDYHNPSIQDFLVNYLNSDRIVKENLIKSVLFLEPALNIFCLESDSLIKQRIILDKTLQELLQNHLISKFDTLKVNPRMHINTWMAREEKNLIKLFLINDFFKPTINTALESFIHNSFLEIIYYRNISHMSLAAYTKLIKCFYNPKMHDSEIIFLIITECISNFDQLEYLLEIMELFEREFDNYQESPSDIITEIIEDIVHDIVNRGTSEFEDLQTDLDQLNSIEGNFQYYVVVENEIMVLKNRIKELEDREYFNRYEFDHDKLSSLNYLEDRFPSTNLSNIDNRLKPQDEINLITNLFNSLKQ
ncbi:MAG: hypothetical protein CVV25_09685 [Ignavibacteriae bacterium HGW-Ignavibacteriae-4]|jgi:hypothetical protein|nr:MAG: hypothetical protein CVV25_09685 [Ignavibacteriae bacterium HGW-Ignavibacteriae-4]